MKKIFFYLHRMLTDNADGDAGLNVMRVTVVA